MSQTQQKDKENRFGFLNLMVLVLSIYVLLVLFLDTVLKLPTEISKLLYLIDNVICLFFISEFCYRFYKAENKIKFMYWGWIDLVSSIPTFHFLRVGRLFRLIRVFRILRAFRTTKHLVHHIFRNKAEATTSMVSILAILIVIFSSIAILQVEIAPNSNIKTAEDALWWSFGTITTVAYGDKYPVTTEGRIIGVVLMIFGLGLITTVTGFVASKFITGDKEFKKD